MGQARQDRLKIPVIQTNSTKEENQRVRQIWSSKYDK
jgi:hypothetical protein